MFVFDAWDKQALRSYKDKYFYKSFSKYNEMISIMANDLKFANIIIQAITGFITDDNKMISN